MSGKFIRLIAAARAFFSPSLDRSLIPSPPPSPFPNSFLPGGVRNAILSTLSERKRERGSDLLFYLLTATSNVHTSPVGATVECNREGVTETLARCQLAADVEKGRLRRCKLDLEVKKGASKKNFDLIHTRTRISRMSHERGARGQLRQSGGIMNLRSAASSSQ